MTSLRRLRRRRRPPPPAARPPRIGSNLGFHSLLLQYTRIPFLLHRPPHFLRHKVPLVLSHAAGVVADMRMHVSQPLSPSPPPPPRRRRPLPCATSALRRPAAALLVAACLVGASPSTDEPVRVLWLAPWLSGGGYSSEALAFARGAAQAPSLVSLAAVQHGDGVDGRYARGLPAADASVLQAALQAGAARGAAVGAVCVCHSEPGAWHLPPALPRAWATETCPPAAGCAARVGRTMFETDRLPAGWPARLLAMDALWVPSRFSADIFAAAGVPRDRLRLLPEGVDVDFFSRESAAAAEARDGSDGGGGGDDGSLPVARTGCEVHAHGTHASCPFRFLSVGKWERRKNFEALVYAFLAEFCPRGSCAEHVELHILTAPYHSNVAVADDLAALIGQRLVCDGAGGAAAAELPPPHCLPEAAAAALARTHAIVLWHGVPQAHLPRLYASVDALVQPSRGEGWGRPHVEAMAMGLPVLATNWSGVTEFLTSSNGYPLRVASFAPIPTGAFAGHLQAEVAIDDLRATMRAVATTAQAEAAARGARARTDMRERFAPAVVAARLAELAREAARMVAAASRNEL